LGTFLASQAGRYLEAVRREPSNLPGRSLVPLLRGETAAHREEVFAEYVVLDRHALL
jgi:hypothetical protein